MTDGKIIVRTGRNIFFKSKVYDVKINGKDIRKVDFKKSKIEYNLPMGKYKLEIGGNNSFKTTNIILLPGQIKIFTINPNLSYDAGLGLLMGAVVVAIAFQLLAFDKFSISLMVSPLIPLLLLSKRNYSESFELRDSR